MWLGCRWKSASYLRCRPTTSTCFNFRLAMDPLDRCLQRLAANGVGLLSQLQVAGGAQHTFRFASQFDLPIHELVVAE